MELTQVSKKFTNKEGIKIVTNYKDAVNWLHNDYVICNNIVNVDVYMFENARFSLYELNEDGTESDDIVETYQYFITSASESDINYLEKRFGLLFTYSDLLDVYVLCVPHYGTAWDYVYCEDSEKDEYWNEQIKQNKEVK